jgi:hypothetical protein
VGAVVRGVVELLGEGEIANEERGDEAGTVARFDGSRWSEAHTVAHRRSRCGRELRVAVVLLARGCNRALKHVSEVHREKRKLEEEEQRREKAGAHRNRR